MRHLLSKGALTVEGDRLVVPAQLSLAILNMDPEADGCNCNVGMCASQTSDEVRQVFAAWAELHWTGTRQPKLDTKRRSRIQARLREGFSPEQLIQALRGALLDDFLMGRDKAARRPYRGLETLLRDAAQVERLAELAARAGPTQAGFAADDY